MKESLIKSVVSTLLVTILVIWMKIDHRVDNPLDSIKVGRTLQTAEGATPITRAEYASSCIINGTDLGLVPGFNSEFTTLNAYIKSLDYYEDKFNADITKVIVNDESPAKLIGKVFGGYILIAIFAIITFISYFVCIGCCFKQCCCCHSDKKQEGWGTFKGISFILAVAGLAGIIVACAIGWTYAREIPEELDVLDCTMMKFYLNFRQGEEKTQVPKWVGLDRLITSFTNIETALDRVFAQSQGNVFQTGVGIVFDTNRVEANKNSYYALLDRKWTENAGGLTRSPNPNVQGTATPVLISNFGPASNQGSSLNMLRNEYELLITNTTEVLRSFRQTTPNMNSNISTGKAIFRYVTDNLRPFDAELKKFDDDYISFFRARVSFFLLRKMMNLKLLKMPF